MSKDKDIENNRPKLTIENAPDTERTEQEAETTEQRKPEEEAPTLKEIIREQATEDELPLSKNFTLRKILGGDILTTSTIYGCSC